MPNARPPKWLSYLAPIITTLLLAVAVGLFHMYTQVQLLQWRVDFYHGVKK